MKKEHPLDSYFKKGVAEHKTAPSSSVWERVEAGTSGSSSRPIVWYMMRAAIVVLMLSFGTWFLDQPIKTNNIVEVGVEPTNNNNNAKKQQSTPPSTNETPQVEKAAEKPATQPKKAMPLMKNTKMSKRVFVNNDELPVVDEQLLAYQTEEVLATETLNPEKVAQYDKTPLKVKMKFTQPVTKDAFYSEAEGAEEKEQFGKKLYAYANTQFSNLRQGKPLELPKTGKPQLQINLDRILNN